MQTLRLKLSLFPSPIGELHFSIVRNTLGEIRFRVSVPYRGATFLNRAWELVKKSAMTDFRPLSGSYISQSNVLSEYVKNVNFRPLSGSYISQYKCMVYRLQVIIFPSPIGELHFSILLKNS